MNEKGEVLKGMVFALAGDIRNMVLRETAPERAKNPAMLGLVMAAASGLAFHRLLDEFLATCPPKDREALRTKIREYAENTAAGLPTSPLSGPHN